MEEVVIVLSQLVVQVMVIGRVVFVIDVVKQILKSWYLKNVAYQLFYFINYYIYSKTF